jgi:hypothetical protein
MSSVEVCDITNPTSNETAQVIRGLLDSDPEHFQIEFESETINRPTAKYDVKRFLIGAGGKPMLEFEGRRENGARFTIDSNPTGQPLITNHYDNSPDKTEKLQRLRILRDEADIDTRKGWFNF